MVDPNNARMSYLEAWAQKLEVRASEYESTTGWNQTIVPLWREQAKALRDQVAFCRELLGITHTPIDTRPTMEIRNERN